MYTSARSSVVPPCCRIHVFTLSRRRAVTNNRSSSARWAVATTARRGRPARAPRHPPPTARPPPPPRACEGGVIDENRAGEPPCAPADLVPQVLLRGVERDRRRLQGLDDVEGD